MSSTKQKEILLQLSTANELEVECKLLSDFRELLKSSENTEQFFNNEVILDQFVTYLFNRRFGWSDAERSNSFEGKTPLRIRSSSIEESGKIKKEINDLADDFLNFLRHQPVATPILDTLLSCISQAANKAVVRKQTFHHYFEWLKQQFAHSTPLILDQVENNFEKIQKLIVIGITDVWSAIRKTCSTGLSSILDYLTIPQIERIYNEFTEIAHDETATWQAKEGSILAISSVLDSFTVDPILTPPFSISNDNVGLYSIPFTLKHGDFSLKSLPQFMTTTIRFVLYRLLAHPQLSIREYAIHAFDSFLQRSCFQDSLDSFYELVSRLLSNLIPSPIPKEDTVNGLERLFSTLSTTKTPWLLDAYESEAFLGVCSILVKNVSATTTSFFKLEHWKLYLFTFLLYLSHPASTVRQGSSCIFKDMISKNQSSSVVKILLQSLAADWKFEDDSSELFKLSKTFNPLPTLNFLNTESLQLNTWEWKEGRFFAYELILKFMITNHTHYVSDHEEKVLWDNSFQQVCETKAMPWFHKLVERSYPIIPGSPGAASLLLSPSSPAVITPLSKSFKPSPPNMKQHSFVFPSGKESPLLQPSFVSPEKDSPSLNATFPKSLKRSSSAYEFSPRNSPISVQIPTLHHHAISLIDQLNTEFSFRLSMDGTDLATVKLAKTSDIFRQILLQTTSCFHHDTRWELIRMADQVIPLLTEAIFYIDLSIFEQLWPNYIRYGHRQEDLCYAACKTLKFALRKVITLEESFMKFPDNFWSSLEDKERVHKLIERVKQCIPQLVPEIYSLACQEDHFRVSVSATELLLLIHTFWGMDHTLDQSTKYIHVVMQRFHQMNLSTINPDQDPASINAAVKRAQFLRSNLQPVFSILPKFILTCNLDQMLTLIPDLIELILRHDDPEIQLSLLETIVRAMHYTVKCADGEKENESILEAGTLENTCNLCVTKLINLMQSKTLETVIVRKLLDIFRIICALWHDLRYLPVICKYVATSMNQETIVKILQMQQENSTSLQILSNDIKHKVMNEEGSDSEDDNLMKGFISDDSSDWDNWDDDGDVDINTNIKEVAHLLETLSDEFSPLQRYGEEMKIDQCSNSAHNSLSMYRQRLGLTCNWVSYPTKMNQIPASQRSVINWITTKFGSKKQ